MVTTHYCKEMTSRRRWRWVEGGHLRSLICAERVASFVSEGCEFGWTWEIWLSRSVTASCRVPH